MGRCGVPFFMGLRGRCFGSWWAAFGQERSARLDILTVPCSAEAACHGGHRDSLICGSKLTSRNKHGNVVLQNLNAGFCLSQCFYEACRKKLEFFLRGLAFPNDKNFPAEFPQQSDICSVTRYIFI